MYKKEDADVVRFVKGIVNNAYDKSVFLTRFLTLKEIEYLKSMCGNNFYIYLEGGHDNSKLQRCLVSNMEMENPNLKVDVLKLKVLNSFKSLKHPTVKWHFLNLGIDERMFGDIVAIDDYFIVVVCSEISETLINETKSINKCNVVLKKTLQKFEVSEKPLEISFTSSLRLDGVCSKCFNISRNKAQDFVEHERVKVNGNVVSKISSKVNAKDTITIIGLGKVVIKEIEINNKTKRFRIYHNKYLR